MNFNPQSEIVEGSDHEFCFSQHLYAAGHMTFQRAPNHTPYIQGNLYTEKKFLKYFGKKLRSLASSSKRKVIPISTYRCKTLKTLVLLTDGIMKSPIISLKNLDIVSRLSSMTRISGYKNLTSLKIDRIALELKLDLPRQLKTLVHLRFLCLKIYDHTLAKVPKYILGLKSLKHLDIEILKVQNGNHESKAIVRDFYFALMKSKTLSYLKLNIQQITDNSDDLTLLLEILSQIVIPNFDINVTCQQDYNVNTETLEAALSNVDLLTIDRSRCMVRLSTNQENPNQPIAQARRKLNLSVPGHPFKKINYIPRAQLFNSDSIKNDFDLTDSLKLFFGDSLSASFSLFNASNIQCVKAIKIEGYLLQEDKTLEGFKNLQSIIKNSPSLEYFKISKADFDQCEAVLLLDELAKLQQLETLDIRFIKFHSKSVNDKKTLPVFLTLKEINLASSDVRMDELPFDIVSSKNLTELAIKYPSVNDTNGERMLKTIKKLSNLENITIYDTPFFSDETDITGIINMMSQLTKLKEVYFLTSLSSAFPFDYDKAVVNIVSKSLHEKVIELLKRNKSIEKFIVTGGKYKGNPFAIKCIRY